MEDHAAALPLRRLALAPQRRPAPAAEALVRAGLAKVCTEPPAHPTKAPPKKLSPTPPRARWDLARSTCQMSADNSPKVGLGHPDSSIAAALAASTPLCTPKSQSWSTSIHPFVQGGLSLLDLILQPLLTHQVTSGAAPHAAASGAHWKRLPKKKKACVRALSAGHAGRAGGTSRELGGGGGPREPLPVSRSLRSALQSRSSWRRANSSGASRRRPQLQNAVRAAACCVLRCALWGPGRPGRGRRASPWRLPVPRPAATPESNAERR